MDKLRRAQGSSVPEDEESLRKIVEVVFPTGEPRTSFPNQEHREAGEAFSPQKLKAAVSRLSPGKSPGLDGIPNEVVRTIAKENPQMLMSVFNKCLQEGIFPDRWKSQKLVLIPKITQATAADPSSFRPLGMIDSTGKLLERIILNRMEIVYEEEDNEESAAQFGFRKGLTRSWECIYQSLAEEKKMLQYLIRIMDSYLKDRKLTIVTVEGRIVTRKKIPYEKLVEYLLKITRVLMKSGTNLNSIKFYNTL